MNGILSKLYLQECKFVNSMTSNIITIIKTCGQTVQPPSSGKVLSGINLEYATDALATDVYTLSIDGKEEKREFEKIQREVSVDHIKAPLI